MVDHIETMRRLCAAVRQREASPLALQTRIALHAVLNEAEAAVQAADAMQQAMCHAEADDYHGSDSHAQP